MQTKYESGPPPSRHPDIDKFSTGPTAPWFGEIKRIREKLDTEPAMAWFEAAQFKLVVDKMYSGSMPGRFPPGLREVAANLVKRSREAYTKRLAG